MNKTTRNAKPANAKPALVGAGLQREDAQKSTGVNGNCTTTDSPVQTWPDMATVFTYVASEAKMRQADRDDDIYAWFDAFELWLDAWPKLWGAV